MAAQLHSLRWVSRWVSHLGCLRACLDYLGIEISDGWLYGGTGHAFVINMHGGVCPSGPTAWKTERLFELAPNLGYAVEGVFAHKGRPDFADSQRRAHEFAEHAIDSGLPCYGWELRVPEYYVVYGYDDTGYLFSWPGVHSAEGAKPWNELGATGIGILEMYSIRPNTETDDRTAVRDALSFALRHADNPSDWIYDGYRSGVAGFDNWINAVASGTASLIGMGYNAAVWSECRRFAVEFLKESKDRIAAGSERLSTAFDEAVSNYSTVSSSLSKISEAYPWRPGVPDEVTIETDSTSEEAVEILTEARGAEKRGLSSLRGILDAMGVGGTE